MAIKSIVTIVMGGALLAASPVYSAMSSDIMVTHSTQRAPLTAYVGGAFGNADYDKANDSDVGFSLLGGFKPWDSLGFEFAYVDLGKPSFSSNSDIEVTLFRAGVVASHEFLNGQIKGRFSIFGQTGLAVWDSSISGMMSSSDSGTDLYFGFGGLQSLGGRSSLRFAVDFYSLKRDIGDENIRFISIGFQQGF